MSGRGPACEARTHTGRSAGTQKKGERRSDPVAAKRGQWGLRCAIESLSNLVLTQQWQVQQDLEGLRVGRHHNELRNATIQRLGGCGSDEGGAVGYIPLDREVVPGRAPSFAPFFSCL